MAPSIEQEIRDLHELFGSARDPEGRAFVPLADAYRRAGLLERALRILSEGAERHPDLPSASLVEGLVRRDLDDAPGAEAAFRRVLDLDPDNAQALVELGRVLALRADADAAEESGALVRRGLALDPTLADASPRPSDADAAGEGDELVAVDDLAPVEDLAPTDDLAPGWSESGDDAWGAEPTGDGAEAREPVEEAGGGDSGADSGTDAAAAGLSIDWDLDDGAGWSESEEAPTEAELVPSEEAPAEAEVFASDPIEEELDPWSEPETPPAPPPISLDRLPTGEVPPEALIMDLSEVVPDLEPGAGPAFDEPDDDDEVVPTRTLGELYARQGLTDEAIAVFEALSAADPTDLESRARLVELRAGEAPAPIETTGEDTSAPSIRDSLRALLTWAPAEAEADGESGEGEDPSGGPSFP